MLLRELMEKIDKNTSLCIMKAPDIDNVFRRNDASDAIPDTLLDMKVRAIFTESELLYIYVQRNAKNGSFGEFLNSLDIHACIDVCVLDHDGKTVKEFHDKDFYSNDEYNDYLVKRISVGDDGWDGRISVVIEPDDYIWSYVGY